MQKIIDFHIHSKYSRACSRDLELPKIAQACAIKGVDIISTGDFTHPRWMEHIKENLVEEGEGVYRLKVESQKSKVKSPVIEFVLGTEVAVIKKHKEQTRRVHLCLFAPSIAVAEKFNQKLDDDGYNLKSDGRPILGLTCKDLLELMLNVDERMVMIPAHAWTPWFGIFGSKGGYDSLEDAFEDLTPHIRAIETGLSSDPSMNWRLSVLDNISLISNSDAHSLEKIGREANVLQFENEQEINFKNIFAIINDKKNYVKPLRGHVINKFLSTIEFYPEEGKYHYDGHRDCKYVCAPEQTKKMGGICPVCKRELTIGVMNRVNELADRSENEAHEFAKKNNFIPYHSLVPLAEIIADTLQVGVKSKAVVKEYNNLIKIFNNEFNILLNVEIAEIKKISESIGEAIKRVREKNIVVRPGYDGEFGVVKVFEDNEKRIGVIKQNKLI